MPGDPRGVRPGGRGRALRPFTARRSAGDHARHRIAAHGVHGFHVRHTWALSCALEAPATCPAQEARAVGTQWRPTFFNHQRFVERRSWARFPGVSRGPQAASAARFHDQDRRKTETTQVSVPQLSSRGSSCASRRASRCASVAALSSWSGASSKVISALSAAGDARRISSSLRWVTACS